MKKRLLTFILLLVCIPFLSNAIPVMPGITKVLNGDGKYLNVTVIGDDFFHYTLLKNGYLIGQSSKGVNAGYYVYAYTDQDGRIVLTDERVGYENTSLTKGVTSKRQKGISSIAIARAKQRREQRMAENSTAPSAFAPRRNINSPATRAETKVKGVILLIEFPDLPFSYNQSDFDRMMNLKGYSENGAIGSAADFFNENSMGQVDFSFDVYGPIEVTKGYAYYGSQNAIGMDSHADELLVEAAHIAAREHGVDFSLYDQDADGDIDMIFYFFAGHNEAEGAEETRIWPHKWDVYPFNIEGSGLSVDVSGKTIKTYACTSELKGTSGAIMASIGLFCHEFSHMLGLADTYDADYTEGGLSAGMGSYALMSAGAYNNSQTAPPYFLAFEREMIGWLDRSEITLEDEDKFRQISLGNIKDNKALVIETETPFFDYYIECRGKDGWDAGIPEEGVLIYYIDRSTNKISGQNYSARYSWLLNAVNNVLDHMCADIIKSDGSSSEWLTDSDLENGWIYPYRGNNSLTANSSPSSVSRFDDDDHFIIENIVYNGDGTASFSVGKFNLELEAPLVTIKVPSGGFAQGSALELNDINSEIASVVWYINGKKSTSISAGTNVEIRANVTYKSGVKEILMKYANIK